MINVSTAFKQALANDQRDYIEKVKITLKNGTVLNLTNANIWEGGFTIEDAVSSDNSFDIGSAIINQATIVINNIYDDYSAYDFNDAKVVLKTGLSINGSDEVFQKGEYTVSEAAYNGSIITLKIIDNMVKFDAPYSSSNLIYPATLDTIIRDACSMCDVQLNSLNFPHKNYVIAERPSGDDTTFREVISYIAQIAGCFARCNADGELELKWYDQATFETLRENVDGGIFDDGTPSYITGDSKDGGRFNPWNTGDVVDGGLFGTGGAFHVIGSLYSSDVNTDDVVITGIKINVKTKDEDGSEAVRTFSVGTNDYALVIENNDLINTTNAQEIITWLGTQLIGLRFRPLSVSHSSDPTIEAGDIAVVYDRKQNAYPILITSTTFSAGGAQQTKCSAESARRNSATRFTESTKMYVELRKQIINEKTDREQALDDLSEALSEVNQMYTYSEYDQSNKLVAFYIMNKPTLAESDVVWKITTNAFGVSTDGGNTWNLGATADGDLIARVLNAVGVNASWINAGQFVVKDQNNNITFSADTETGVVRIVASEFSLTSGDTIQSIANAAASGAVTSANSYTDTQVASARSDANAALSTFADSVTSDIADIQAQLDGVVDTYYYNYMPTTSNIPAVDWTTEQLKQDHEGDLFLDTSTGKSYRWVNENNVWQWKEIPDTASAQALVAAQAAQDTADHKRRVFITQPVPPYDEGDLWAQGASGDILRCTTAKAEGTSYSSSDWGLASKYTDDSALTTFVNGAYATTLQNIQSQIDGKAETWYQAADPSTSWSSTEKPKHEGDLWYKTTDGTTWYYTGSTWQQQNVPDAVFDEIDGKAQIFVGSTTPVNPQSGDLWFKSANDDILTYINNAWTKYNKYVDAAAISSAISALQSTLEAQIDSKIETYYQSANPASNWTTAALKESHDGDLWYYTGTTTASFTNGNVYRYSYNSTTQAGTWEDYTSAPDLSGVWDAIDGKSSIYYGTTSGTYPNVETGDYLVDNTDGSTYRYSGSAWVKVTDYASGITTVDNKTSAKYGTCTTATGTAAKVVTLANFSLYTGARISVHFTNKNTANSPTLNVNSTGARPIYAYGAALTSTSAYNWTDGATVEFVYNGTQWEMADSGSLAKVNALDTGLDQTSIFNRLTNNGTAQGIFMQDGQLYINMSYLQTGTLKLGGANNVDGVMEVYDASGNRTGLFNNNGLTLTNENKEQYMGSGTFPWYVDWANGRIQTSSTSGLKLKCNSDTENAPYSTFAVLPESNRLWTTKNSIGDIIDVQIVGTVSPTQSASEFAVLRRTFSTDGKITYAFMVDGGTPYATLNATIDMLNDLISITTGGNGNRYPRITFNGGNVLCDGSTAKKGRITGITVPANGYVDKTVTFSGGAFSDTPTVVCSIRSSSTSGDIGSLTACAINESTTGFTCRIFNSSSSSRSPNVSWIAI